MRSHTSIENELCGIEIIDEEQARNPQRQRSYGECIEEVRVDAIGHPQQYGGFDEPADRNPVRVEADGDCDRDEADSQGEVQKVQGLSCSGIGVTGTRLPAQEDVGRSQSQRKPRHGGSIDLLIHRIDLEEVHAGVYEGEEERQSREQGGFVVGLARDERGDGKDGEEQRGES